MTQSTAPTSEFIYATLWLGGLNSDGNVTPTGTGVVVHHREQEFLATALHVARQCNFQPLVRRNGFWGRCHWSIVGIDEEADIVVLEPHPANLSNSTPEYGRDGVTIGAVGRAMGFPALSDPGELDHIGELEGHPIPVTVLVSSYFSQLEGQNLRVHYLGGYVNAGFSGGPILLPSDTGWRIAGIITHREAVVRSMYRRNEETGETERILYGEPSGLIRFADIRVAIELIDNFLDRQGKGSESYDFHSSEESDGSYEDL